MCPSRSFPENETRTCDPRDGKQSRYGAFFVDKSCLYNDRRSVRRKLFYGAFRLPSCPVAEVRQYRHRNGNGHDRARLASYRRRFHGKEKDPRSARRHGSRRVHFPICLYGRVAFRYAGIHAEIRFVRHRCRGNLDPVSERTFSAS